jgi:hypothetical protein
MPPRELELARAIHRALCRQGAMFAPYVEERPVDMERVTIHGDVSLLAVARELISQGWKR